MQTQIVVDLPPEIQLALDENGISIQEILSANGINADVSFTASQGYDSESRDKAIVPIILASSALILSISFALSKIIKTIYAKPYLVEIQEWEELRNENGDIALDPNGKPLAKLVKRFELIQPDEQNNKSGFDVDFSPTNGIKLKFVSQDNKPIK